MLHAVPGLHTGEIGRVAYPMRRERQETILLVDDEAGIRKLVRRVLEHAGYCVLDAASGQEALGIVARGTVGFDLVIADVIMPQMSGPKLIERLLALEPELPVLYMSAFVGSELIRHESPGFEVIAKPFTPAALISKVRRVLEKRVRGAA